MSIWLVIALCGAIVGAVLASALGAAVTVRRKWRDVRGIKRSYWFDKWIL